MLLRFSAKNFKSLRNKTELSMLKAANSSELPHHISAFGQNKYLKAAAIIGPNASGKSNIFEAMSFAIRLMKQPVEKYKVPFFRLDEVSKNEPTEFEFDILIDKKHFWYSFGIKSNLIQYEFLKLIEGKKEIEIYSRDNNKYAFGASYWSKDELAAISPIQTVVQKHNLLLGEFRNRETKLQTLTKWITSKIIFLTDAELNKNLNSIKNNFSNQELQKVTEFIRKADVGISDVSVVDDSANAQAMFNALKEKFNAAELESVKNTFFETLSKRIEITHSANNLNAKFGYEDESRGTQKFLQLLPVLLKVKDSVTFVCDELETSLHPSLTKYFIQNFFKENVGFNSQLIFSTHEHTLMELDTLRRDEIWFTQKNKNQETEFYSLAEFNQRNDKNIPKGYMEGRFGAIPFLPNLSNDPTEST